MIFIYLFIIKFRVTTDNAVKFYVTTGQALKVQVATGYSVKLYLKTANTLKSSQYLAATHPKVQVAID